MHVYADNAATTKMSTTAINAMIPYFETMYGNPSSLHSIGQEAKEALEKAGRTDLIGFGKECLVPPPNNEKRKEPNGAKKPYPKDSKGNRSPKRTERSKSVKGKNDMKRR